MRKIILLLLMSFACGLYAPVANAMKKTKPPITPAQAEKPAPPTKGTLEKEPPKVPAKTYKEQYTTKLPKKQEEKLLDLLSLDGKDLEIIKLINNIDGKGTKLDPNYVLKGDRLIFHAVFSQFPLLVQDLLNKGAEVNFSRMFGKNKMSLLDIACSFSSTKIIKMLVDSEKIANFKEAAKSAIKWILNPHMIALAKEYKITAIKLLIAKEPSLGDEPLVKEYLSKVESRVISEPLEISAKPKTKK